MKDKARTNARRYGVGCKGEGNVFRAIVLRRVSITTQLQFLVWRFTCGTTQAWLCQVKFTIHFQHS